MIIILLLLSIKNDNNEFGGKYLAKIWFISSVLGAVAGIAVGAHAGIYSATVSTAKTENSFPTAHKGWLFSDTVGSPSANALERARIALGGPLALSSTEAVYFLAVEDSEGIPLRSQCSYRVKGQPIDTRWWSLSLYDAGTGDYIPNPENRSSWTNVSVPRQADSAWAVHVTRDSQTEGRLAAPREDDVALELLLRLYHPSLETRMKLPDIDLPIIERQQCL